MSHRVGYRVMWGTQGSGFEARHVSPVMVVP